MSRIRILAVLIAVTAAVLTFVFWPRTEPSPEELIQRQVIQMARAAEEKNVSFIFEQISERFRGQQGWDKREVKGVLTAHILRREWVRVFPVNIEVKMIQSNVAELHTTFVFGRSDAKEPQDLPKESIINAYAVDGTLEREEDGEWRFISATHRAVNPLELF